MCFSTGVNKELLRNVKQVLLELTALQKAKPLHFKNNILPTKLLAFQLFS